MMKKKNAKNQSAISKKTIETKPLPVPDEKTEPEEKPFDFGGLPERDLKKNLGCG